MLKPRLYKGLVNKYHHKEHVCNKKKEAENNEGQENVKFGTHGAADL